MNIAYLLSRAEQLGVEIQVHNGKLFANGKSEAVKSILPLIKTYKSDILNHFNIINRSSTYMEPQNNNVLNGFVKDGSMGCPREMSVDGVLSPITAAKINNSNRETISYLYNERAAILEFDGDMNREEAERAAYNEALVVFMRMAYPEIMYEFQSIISLTIH